MSSEELSDEQRARIQQNREKALALRRQKLQRDQQQSPSENQNSQGSGSSSEERLTAIMDPTARPTDSRQSFGGSAPSASSSTFVQGSSSSAGLESKYWNEMDDHQTDKRLPVPEKIKVQFQKTPAKCVLTMNHRFYVACGYQKEAIEIFRTIYGASYSPPTKTWSFPLSSYRELENKLKQLPTIALESLPAHVISTFARYIAGSSPDKAKPQFNLKHVDDTLLSRLFPFQLECINLSIARGGRILIADDMGLGKTVEALGILSYYRDDWPVLIICPASLRYTWKHAFAEWLPSVKEYQIAVIDANSDFPFITQSTTQVAIIGYSSELLKNPQHLAKIQQKFKVVVLDESHFIKTPETQRTKACEKILKGAKRVILLSGTPALSRPKELFTQIKAVDPKLFRCFRSFGARYCDPKEIRVRGNKLVMDYSGASNMEELEALLKETIMIRRIKEDVLDQLPAKIHGIVLLDSRLVKMDEKAAQHARSSLQSAKLNGSQKRGALLEFYNVTAAAKAKAVTQYVLDLLEQNRKFLVFAHHKVMMDHLEKSIANTDHDIIRIDGSTPAMERQQLCDRFQTDERVRVALLSITASGTGLTLTAANLVVFAELFWNPGVLVQAEDRAHRVGQLDCVSVQYLVAQGTADDFIWPLIQRKLDILNKGGLSKGAFKTEGTTMMGQRSITDYIESISEDNIADEELFNGSPNTSSTKRQRTR